MTHGAYDRDCGALRGPDLWRTYGIDEGSGILRVGDPWARPTFVKKLAQSTRD
jgi:hypothetical protein